MTLLTVTMLMDSHEETKLGMGVWGMTSGWEFGNDLGMRVRGMTLSAFRQVAALWHSKGTTVGVSASEVL